MSKQDSHFINVFSVVIGLLVVAGVGIFAIARITASHTQNRQILQEPAYHDRVTARIRQPSQIGISGQDNSALAITGGGTAEGATARPGPPQNGAEVFQQVCSSCHGATGLPSVPKLGDKALWASRTAEGRATLYEHALKGFQGKSGVMPAKGGRSDLSDDLVRQAVDYLVTERP